MKARAVKTPRKREQQSDAGLPLEYQEDFHHKGHGIHCRKRKPSQEVGESEGRRVPGRQRPIMQKSMMDGSPRCITHYGSPQLQS